MTLSLSCFYDICDECNTDLEYCDCECHDDARYAELQAESLAAADLDPE